MPKYRISATFIVKATDTAPWMDDDDIVEEVVRLTESWLEDLDVIGSIDDGDHDPEDFAIYYDGAKDILIEEV